MVKKTVTYQDFNGNTRTDDFYFNYSKPELLEMELSIDGGLSDLLEKIVNEKDQGRLIEYFKKIVIGSYGIKSPDGLEFLKSDEIRRKFECSAAYPTIFMELATDDEKAADFVNGLMPADVVEQADNNTDQFKALPGGVVADSGAPSN